MSLPPSRARAAAEAVTRAQIEAGTQAAWRNSFLALWCLAWLVVSLLMLGPSASEAVPGGASLHHFVCYAVMTAAAASFVRGTGGLVLATVATLTGASVLEALQMFVPNRLFDVADLGMNAFGAAAGFLLGLFLLSRRRRLWPA